MKPITIIYYAVALILPVLIFTVFTDNTNESKPFLVFVVCIALFGIAGLLASRALPEKQKLTWIGWSVFVGIVEALLLAFAF